MRGVKDSGCSRLTRDQQPLHEGRTDEQPVGVAQTFMGHTGFELQAPSPHVTSHAQASWQSTASHEPLPEQVTLHRPVRQRSSLHESTPLHVTVHDVEWPAVRPEFFVRIMETCAYPGDECKRGVERHRHGLLE